MVKRQINKDVYGGALIVVIGIAILVRSAGYEFGSLYHMGPGFFPRVIGIALVAVGTLIALLALRNLRVNLFGDRSFDLRGWASIVGGLLAFILVGRHGGLVPATFALTVISALGNRGNSVRTAIITALAMCALAVVVFWWLLGLQFPLFTWSLQ